MWSYARVNWRRRRHSSTERFREVVCVSRSRSPRRSVGWPGWAVRTGRGGRVVARPGRPGKPRRRSGAAGRQHADPGSAGRSPGPAAPRLGAERALAKRSGAPLDFEDPRTIRRRGDPAVTGKPVHGDRRERTKRRTCPVPGALHSPPPGARRLVALLEADGEPAEATALIDAAGRAAGRRPCRGSPSSGRRGGRAHRRIPAAKHRRQAAVTARLPGAPPPLISN